MKYKQIKDKDWRHRVTWSWNNTVVCSKITCHCCFSFSLSCKSSFLLFLGIYLSFLSCVRIWTYVCTIRAPWHSEAEIDMQILPSPWRVIQSHWLLAPVPSICRSTMSCAWVVVGNSTNTSNAATVWKSNRLKKSVACLCIYSCSPSIMPSLWCILYHPLGLGTQKVCVRSQNKVEGWMLGQRIILRCWQLYQVKVLVDNCCKFRWQQRVGGPQECSLNWPRNPIGATHPPETAKSGRETNLGAPLMDPKASLVLRWWEQAVGVTGQTYNRNIIHLGSLIHWGYDIIWHWVQVYLWQSDELFIWCRSCSSILVLLGGASPGTAQCALAASRLCSDCCQQASLLLPPADCQ